MLKKDITWGSSSNKREIKANTKEASRGHLSQVVALHIESYIDRYQRLTSGLFDNHHDRVEEYLLVLWRILLLGFCCWGSLWLFGWLCFSPASCEKNPRNLERFASYSFSYLKKTPICFFKAFGLVREKRSECAVKTYLLYEIILMETGLYVF